jgi:putative intracellular protease/amidase
MKRLLLLFMLCSMMVSPVKSVPKILLIIKEGSPQLEFMLTHEVGKMTEIIKQSGFEVVVATVSGEELKAGSITVKPDLKLGEVNIDEYAGFILPCMVVDMASPEMISFVKAVADKVKPIAAQVGSVFILARAGILNGKKYAFVNDQSMDPDFKGALYSGDGVVQDGLIITSGTCPWMAKSTGRKDGTAELSNALIAVIKTLNK